MVTRSFNRSARVGVQVQKVLADLIQKGVSDPRLAQVTITDVELSRDLRIAKVYFATHGKGQDEKDVLAGFESAKGFIKRELAKRLGLRYMPDLRFFYDASFDYGDRISRVIQSLRTNDEKDNPTIDEQ